MEVPFGQELSFSYVGMHAQDIPLYASIINVSLEEDAQALEEVVVIGYGSSGSNDLTSAVSSVNPEQILQGRVAGVNIRGTSTFRSAKRTYEQPEPLYIIDGIPIEGFVEGDLDAGEIQSVEVLKAADASALYGSMGSSGVIIITTKKSSNQEGATKTEFVIKKPYTVFSDNDITAIEINTFVIPATYEYLAAPIINENVFLTASFTNWEQHQLLPGEANIYFAGTYAGKTVLNPYTTKKEMVLSLGIEPNIIVSRKQERNFKSKSFTGNNRILDRTYTLEVKNNKSVPIHLRLLDRIPKSENKEIRVDEIVINNAEMDTKKGLLTWVMKLDPKKSQIDQFSYQVKYPKGRYISL